MSKRLVRAARLNASRAGPAGLLAGFAMWQGVRERRIFECTLS
jgi:hypothetical protein